jgi:uncharacterized membrane protein YwzB
MTLLDPLQPSLRKHICIPVILLTQFWPFIKTAKMSKTKQNFVYKLIEIITFSQVTIPSDNTTYWCSIHKLPDAFAKKHHVIQVRNCTICIKILSLTRLLSKFYTFRIGVEYFKRTSAFLNCLRFHRDLKCSIITSVSNRHFLIQNIRTRYKWVL